MADQNRNQFIHEPEQDNISLNQKPNEDSGKAYQPSDTGYGMGNTTSDEFRSEGTTIAGSSNISKRSKEPGIPDTAEFDQLSTTNTNGIRDRQESYREETAAEIAAPVTGLRRRENTGKRKETNTADMENSGTILGFSALALSILSLFVLPIFLGAAGIVLGYVAMRRGSRSMGGWAIGIGAVSIIIGLFILPFYR
ncbi:DUF308 domain-containing protein [Bacillus massilinigeriensis]|uniref:DUF308 domain-containing protein n=1 Tax=Bacillus mediterraneensis TaxID=1805474 RepID=UPI000A4BA3D5|nr:DUF308 domain-containing protein [Bacillus mediterraneensis]